MAGLDPAALPRLCERVLPEHGREIVRCGQAVPRRRRERLQELVLVSSLRRQRDRTPTRSVPSPLLLLTHIRTLSPSLLYHSLSSKTTGIGRWSCSIWSRITACRCGTGCGICLRHTSCCLGARTAIDGIWTALTGVCQDRCTKSSRPSCCRPCARIISPYPIRVAYIPCIVPLAETYVLYNYCVAIIIIIIIVLLL